MKRQHLRRDQLEAVADVFAVLAEPTRLEILQFLNEGECTVGKLVEGLGAKQANVSKQLGILHDAGLLERQRRGSQVFYSIREPMVFDLCGLVCRKLKLDAEKQARLFANVGK